MSTKISTSSLSCYLESRQTLARFMGFPVPSNEEEAREYDTKFSSLKLPGLRIPLEIPVSATERAPTRILEAIKSFRSEKIQGNSSKQFPQIPYIDWSQTLVSPVPDGTRIPRDYWLAHPEDVRPPWIVCGSFVPRAMLACLMANKKESALGVKWEEGDDITNMEGAMHTFVTSIVFAWMHGEYCWNQGHDIDLFGNEKGFQKARMVLVSNMIHQDFETDEVMMKVAALTAEPTKCTEMLRVPTLEQKRNPKVRAMYDESLRRWMVRHLTADGELPSIQEASSSSRPPMSRKAAIDFLQHIVTNRGYNILEAVRWKYFWLKDRNGKAAGLPLLSLEVLITTAFYQFAIEFYALDRICGLRGYHYTFNPPKIFGRALGNDGRLMALIYAAGLCHYAGTTSHSRMLSFETSDVEGGWSYYMKFAIGRLASRGNMFDQYPRKLEKGTGETIESVTDAIKVIHNNSDGFGQNIRSEEGLFSLDAVIGQYSSASASLLETRDDLLRHIIDCPI